MVIRSMIGLDTNVLVRLFAHDGDAQSAARHEELFPPASRYPLAYIRAN